MKDTASKIPAEFWATQTGRSLCTAMHTNAWDTGFLYEDENHPYAIAVVVEKGGAGGSVAAPIAAKALKKAIDLGL